MRGVLAQITVDVLRHLSFHGACTRAEVVAAVGDLPVSTLGNLRVMGHISADHTTKEIRYSITPRGRNKLSGEALRRQRSDADRLKAARLSNNYLGAELFVPSSRPGAMDAYGLPSRVADRLHWPDGRITPITHSTTGEITHV
ncbi:MAG: hypothetical protein IBJ14_04905 [Hydrogenophaga sp.]|nr:hypothetical protein [Hydrogenophaga sp.]